MYQHVKFLELQVALAKRLGDPNNVFWSFAETAIYIAEAIQTWAAYSKFYRDRGTITLRPGVPFYDLNQELVPVLTQPTGTDQQLIENIEGCLLEPISSTSWIGSEQFTYYDVVQAIQRRRNQFLLETGMVLTATEQSSVSPSDGRAVLQDFTVDVRRAAWKTPEGIYNTLWRSDERELNSYLRGWAQNPGPPQYYSVAAAPPLRFQIAPPPSDAGSLNLITIRTPQALDPANGPTVLGIPDDFLWVIKFGVLADLLSGNSPSIDESRAAYCQSRWKDGIALARITSSVMTGQIDGDSINIDDLFDVDAWNTSWMNSSEVPYQILCAGYNLVAANPVPNDTHSLVLDLISKAPFDSEFVQVGREHVDMILDYAFHLAAFKMGGKEFLTTMDMYENLVNIAAVNNDQLRANAESFDILHDRSLKEGESRSRRKSDLSLEAA